MPCTPCQVQKSISALMVRPGQRPTQQTSPPACFPPLLQPGSLGGMSQRAAQALFGFGQFEALHDESTDTRVLLSWREGCLLVSFRGTASRTNAFTDLKLWTTPVLPRRHYGGRLVKVHAGGWVGGWVGGWASRSTARAARQVVATCPFASAGLAAWEAVFAHPSVACCCLLSPPTRCQPLDAAAGFYGAYSLIRQRLLDRVGEIVGGFSPGAGLQLYLTGALKGV